MDKNNKKQPKHKFPANMPTGLNMTWWYTDDIETIIASMQLKIDYMHQKLEEAKTTTNELKDENKANKEKISQLNKQFSDLRKKTEHKLHYLKDYMDSKLEEFKINNQTKN